MALFLCYGSSSIPLPSGVHHLATQSLEALSSIFLNKPDPRIGFGSHTGKLLRSVPGRYATWMATELRWTSKPLQISVAVLREIGTCHVQTSVGHHQSEPARNEDCGSESWNEETLSLLRPETDIDTYASLLRRCTVTKALSEGKRVHQHMSSNGYLGNIFLTNLLIQMYSRCGALEYARAVFDTTICRNLHSWNLMIAACAKNGSLDDARAVFGDMPQRDVVSWSAMIAACAQNGHGKEALQFFGRMQAEGYEADRITFICVMDACASLAALEEGQVTHATVVGCGFEFDVVVGNALVNMYGKCRRLDDAWAVFSEMLHWNVISWSTMINVCTLNGHCKDALQLFSRMQAEGFEPNKVTFICVLDACSEVAALKEGRVIHASIAGNEIELDAVVGNALANMYGKCGSLDDARAVFAGMLHWNLVSWNAMIGACAQNEQGKEALQLFGHMQAEGFKADRITLISVVDACASAAAAKEGHVIHATIAGDRLEVDVVVGNALVNMYGKSGSLEDAKAVFEDMPQRDVVSWSAMIAVCAQNGHGKEALQLFGQMQAKGFKPNMITFISILTACSHTGLVADGREYFASMNKEHSITPSVEHYVCMIDLLGRRGLLAEAEDLIMSMPFKRVIPAWLCLLSSCRIHNDLDRAVHAADRVFQLDSRVVHHMYR